MNKSKVLLVNFTQREAARLEEKLSITFDRGYISGPLGQLITSSGNHLDPERRMRNLSALNFYFPHPVYDYKVVILNLTKSSALSEEFSSKTKEYSEEERRNFTKYWHIGKKPIIIFLGEQSITDLDDFGIPDIELVKVRNDDENINVFDHTLHYQPSAQMLGKHFVEYKSQVVLPTKYYLRFKKDGIFDHGEGSSFKLHDLYWNNNGDDLGMWVEDNKGYSEVVRPRIFLLPNFKDNIPFIEDTLVLLNNIWDKYFPEVQNLDWISSDTYYPAGIVEFDTKIKTLSEDTDKKIKELREQKETFKKNFESVRGVLYQTGDELKQSVIHILRVIFGLNVIDSDEEETGPLFNEDILVDINGERILCEIKGVKAEYPSPLFIGQVWKHMLQKKDAAVTRGALILNYDIETIPDKRIVAYKGEAESSLDDITFIDTRILFKVAQSVIDGHLKPEDGAAILFGKGRIDF
jgi:hypothetical protein